jgi:hypothetical protein
MPSQFIVGALAVDPQVDDHPKANGPAHVAAPWERALVIGGDLALLLFFWITTGEYTDSLLARGRR